KAAVAARGDRKHVLRALAALSARQADTFPSENRVCGSRSFFAAPGEPWPVAFARMCRIPLRGGALSISFQFMEAIAFQICIWRYQIV
ncbi:hypothetical protein, partial [Diaphorobacter ruginosibacter]|uniref:hypothetical protein n=1 Tax=Diaphorobacter ruginosibacter TaxID=1715720 RepID=UPI0033411C24